MTENQEYEWNRIKSGMAPDCVRLSKFDRR